MRGKDHGSSRHTKMWKVKMFEVIILIAYLTQRAAAEPSCEPSAVWHTDGTEERCCQPFTCHPGFQPKICNISGTLASCSPCPEEKFNSKDLSSALENDIMPLCESFTRCEVQHQEEIRPGNSTHDRVCGCKNEFHELKNEKCYSFCPPGKYWSHKNETCFPCSNGTFKDWKGTEECSPCKQCNTTDTVPCIATNDTVCLEDTKTGPSEDSGKKFPEWAIALIVLLIVAGVALLVCWYYCGKKKHNKWFWCKNSTSSRSTSSRPRSGPDTAANGEAVPMLENGDANASSGPTASGTMSKRIRGIFCCSYKDSSCQSNVEGAGNPAQPVVGLAQQGDNPDQPVAGLAQQGDNPDQPGASLAQQDDNPDQPGASLAQQGDNPDQPGASLAQQGDNPDQPGASLAQQGDNPAQPGASLAQQDDNPAQPVASLAQQDDNPAQPGTSLAQQGDNSAQPEANMDQRDNDTAEPLASLNQPASIAIRLDVNSGQRDDLDQSSGVRAQRGQASGDATQTDPEPDSTCSYVPPPPYEWSSHDTRHWSVPRTMPSGPSTLQEDLNLNLQRDPSAAESTQLDRYMRTIQENYNYVQRVFTPDNFFTGSLYSDRILTEEQLTYIRSLRKQPGGKAEALGVVLDALRRVGDRAAEPFIKALVDLDSRQDALARLIDPERADQLIKERDNPADDGTPDAGKSTWNAQEPGQRVDSIRDDVDFARPNKPPSETPVSDPNETPVKVPLSDPNETPVKVPLSDPNETPVKVPLSDVLDPNETPVKKVGSSMT